MSQRKRKREDDPKILGHIVVLLCSGCVCDDTSYVLRTTKEEAVREATKIIKAYWKDDPIANPKHPHYDPHCDEVCRIDYDELYEAARSLQSTRLNDDDDLLILAIVQSMKKEQTP